MLVHFRPRVECRRALLLGIARIIEQGRTDAVDTTSLHVSPAIERRERRQAVTADRAVYVAIGRRLCGNIGWVRILMD